MTQTPHTAAFAEKSFKKNHILMSKTGFLFLLIALGLFLRIPQVHYGLPAARNPDSFKTVDVAINLADQWRQGEFTLDPGFYQYPTLYANTLAVLDILSFKKIRGEKGGRWLTMLIGLFSAFIIFLIGKNLMGTNAGLVASAILSIGFLFVIQGRSPDTDAMQMSLLGLSIYFLTKSKQMNLQNTLLSGLFVGLAAGTKYAAPIVMAPLVMAVFINSFYKKDRFIVKKVSLYVLLSIVGFLIATPSFLWKFNEFISRFFVESQIQQAGMLDGSALGLGDYLFSIKKIQHRHFLGNSFLDMLGLPFVLIGLMSLGWGFIKGFRERKFVIAGLSISIVFGYVFFYAASNIQAIRFLLPVAFLWVILISLFMCDMGSFFSGWIKKKWKQDISAVFLTSLFTAILLLPNVTKSLDYLKAMKTPNSRLVAANWVLGHIPAQQKVLNFLFGPSLPSGRYDMVQWKFNDHPSLEKLRQEKIEWVIWNDIYTNEFFNPNTKAYQSKVALAWREFYNDMLTYREQGPYTLIKGKISPTIEVFHIPKLPS